MANWGCNSAATTEQNHGGGPRYSGGTFAATGGTLSNIGLFLSGWTGGANFRVGLYQQGTPSSATLIYDSGVFAYNLNPPRVWKTLAGDFGKTLSGALTASVATWFVFKTDNGEVGLSNTEALDLSAGSTVEGAAAIGNDPTVAFPSTYPTTSIVSGAEAMMMYLAYTASGGGGGGSAPVLYRRAAHFVDESLILE